MAKLISIPSVIRGHGINEKIIEEYIGKVRTDQEDISIAFMTAQKGWKEPGQIAEFDEYVYVMRGSINVLLKDKEYRVADGQLIMVSKGEWVQFSTPYNIASYMAICIPAFQEHLVKRDEYIEKN
jgi:ethanolamine utilization protein EutQ (cupin superfamily)